MLLPLRYIATIAALSCCAPGRAQDKVIQTFPDSNQARMFTGIYRTMFTAGRDFHRGPRLTANSSAYLGGSLVYRWFVFAAGFNIPETSVFRDHLVKAFQLAIGDWSGHWGIEAVYQRYKGLVEQTPVGAGVVDAPWQWADYRYASATIEYFLNKTQFSYDAVGNFNRRQTRNGGTPLFMMTTGYQDFTFQKSQADTASGKNNPLYSLIQKDASHGVLMAKAGYAYAFSWDKGIWTLCPLLAAGPGMGVLVLSQRAPQKLFPMLGYQGRLTFGYNGGQWFTYASAYYDLMQATEKGYGLKTINESASVSVGYRFPSLRHRILRVL